MLETEKFIEEYSKSLSTNAEIFKDDKRIYKNFLLFYKIGFVINVILIVYLLRINQKEYLLSVEIIYFFILLIYILIYNYVRVKIINKKFPRIKTCIFKFFYTELYENVQKNIDKFIEENNLNNKVDKLILSLEKESQTEKNSYNIFYAINGALLLIVSNNYISYLFEIIKTMKFNLKETTVITFFIISLIIPLSIFIINIRTIFDSLTTRYEKITYLIKLLEDYQLRKD